MVAVLNHLARVNMLLPDLVGQNIPLSRVSCDSKCSSTSVIVSLI